MFKKIYKIFLQIFFPIECIDCGKDETLLCHSCLVKIPSRLHQPKLSSGIQISVAYGYAIPSIKKIIPRAKYFYSPQLFTDLTLHSIQELYPVFQKKSGILNSFSCALRKTQLIRLVKRILLFILSQLRKKWNFN